MTLESRIAALEVRFANLQKEVAKLRPGSPAKQEGPVAQWLPCAQDTPRVAEVRNWCKNHNLRSVVFTWVPSDYYSHTLQWRRDILKADSISHLCKSIVLVNTHCTRNDCEDPNNSLYYMLLFQYVERFDAELVMRVVKDWNPGVGKKKFNFRLAPEEVSEQITNFTHGAVAPFCTPTKIPVLMSSSILSLSPPYIWAGAGHIDCKLRIDVQEFIDVVKPVIASFTVPLTEEELTRIAD